MHEFVLLSKFQYNYGREFLAFWMINGCYAENNSSISERSDGGLRVGLISFPDSEMHESLDGSKNFTLSKN